MKWKIYLLILFIFGTIGFTELDCKRELLIGYSTKSEVSNASSNRLFGEPPVNAKASTQAKLLLSYLNTLSR